MTNKKPLATKVNMVRLNNKSYYPLPDLKVRVTSRGKIQDVKDLYASITKGEARSLRKKFRAAGFSSHASVV